MTGNGTGGQRPRQSRLYRNPETGILRGVCAGIADYFGIEVWIVRALTIISLFFFTVPTVIAYFVAGLVLSPAPEELYKSEEEKRFWRGVRTEPWQTSSALRHRFRELERRLRGIESYVTSREFRLNREIDELDD